MLLAGDDVEADAGGVAHGVFEGAGGGPLGDAVVADEAKDDRGEDAVEGAEDKRAVGGEKAGVEAGGLKAGQGHGVEGGGEPDINGQYLDEDEE